MNEVERVGRVANISEEFIAGNPGEPGLAAGIEASLKAPLGQFRHDDQTAVDDFDPFNRQQKRMADFLDPIERLEFALSTRLVEPAVNELEGFSQPARRFGFPNFSVSAAP